MTKKYQFDNVKNGTFEEGSTIVRIVDGVAEIGKADDKAQALAWRKGGKPIEPQKSPTKPKTTTKKGGD